MREIRRIAGWMIVGASLFVAACTGEKADNRRPSEARMLVERGQATLLDVRTVQEFNEGHLEGAVNIPVQVLQKRLNELPKDKPVVVYCRDGKRSVTAKRMLDAQGFVRVIDLGTMPDWTK